MFLNAIKLFFAKRLLRNRQHSYLSNAQLSKSFTLGIVFNENESVEIDVVVQTLKSTFPSNYQIDVLVYANDNYAHPNREFKVFTMQDLNLFGRFKSSVANDFRNKKFDLLIHYYKKTEVPLQLVSKQSKALNQVGFYTESANDMILLVDTQINQPTIFFKTLHQYLILTKLI